MTLTILLVDDEEMVLECTGEMLECQGYRTIRARSGTEAVKHLEAGSEEIDMVITDYKMEKDMSGADLLRYIRKRYPFIPVALVSGQPLNDLDVKPFDGYLSKPYTLAQIKKLVEKMNAERQERYGSVAKPAEPASATQGC